MVASRQSKPAPRRVLVKLSGEALGGDDGRGWDAAVLRQTTEELNAARSAGVETALVVGGGNVLRGAALAETGITRVTADHMGMLATIMNALALRDAFEAQGTVATVLATPAIPGIAPGYSVREARRRLAAGAVVLLAGGTGNPFFTTDTAACLRAIEIDADVVVKGTKVDGVYTADPLADPNAEKLTDLTFAELFASRLGVMDLTAAALCDENGMSVVVCDIATPGELTKAVRGEEVGSRIEGARAT